MYSYEIKIIATHTPEADSEEDARRMAILEANRIANHIRFKFGLKPVMTVTPLIETREEARVNNETIEKYS